MSSPKYMMVTVAKCAPRDYKAAIGHLDGLTKDLKKKAGAVTTRHGIMATGDHTGQLVLFQTYTEMNGIDRAFGVYAKSSDYRGLVKDIGVSVTLRNVMRIEDLGLKKPSTKTPAYGVVTRGVMANLRLKKMASVVPCFEKGGAMILRYCTILTGSAAGHRLVVAGYPSLAAVEDTYTRLRKSADYSAVLEDLHVEWRNIIRITG